ncbi:DUF58 domain-containing protein [Kangiella sediminilitoris]|uniref:Uncharacterized protein n=1 Tax=Kangiella sediminilitoris TaxID=1144748 RepID=A0A1B3B9A1_9GAMM|nr:DUF58 domain-containing protein [Kangiella sediminilitoris]AOE49326.1 hypothetical protein KS2013_602 [Kangiella sediminilitoris]
MFRRLKTKLNGWIDKRTPQQVRTELKQNNIYILPTRYGWLMLIILILILIASTNYQNNMGFMAGFIVLAVGMLSVFYTFRNLKGLAIRCHKALPVFAGESAVISMQLANASEQERIGIGIGLTKKSVSYLDVGARAETMAEINVPTSVRGLEDVPRFVCTSIFPFGIFEAWSWVRTPYQILVYPKPLQCPEPLIASRTGSNEGAHVEQGAEDFHSVRDYHPGDPIKQVMWKAFARERGLLSKEFEQEAGEQHSLSWDSVAHYERELAISYLTDAVLQAEESQQLYALQLPHVTIDKDQGMEHMHSCLKALAMM